MEVQYWLRRATIGPQTMLSISFERYEALRRARLTLIDAGAFEHRYELLLGNYFAFESYCSEQSLRSEIERDHRHETWMKVLIETNRHLMNLLTASRSFADHVVRDFKHLDLLPPFQVQAQRQLSTAYDSSLSYRVVCAMRNFVQHCEVPVHGIRFALKAGSEAHAMVVSSSKEKLKEDGKFKASVLDEIDEQIDLRKTAREYMNAVSEVQVGLRKRVEERVGRDRKLIEEAIAEFVAAQSSA